MVVSLLCSSPLLFLQPNASVPNLERQRKERDRISLEIRRKYFNHPEAIKHAAMLIHRDQKNVSAEWVHRKILEDPNNGDVFMQTFENRTMEPAKKMPILTAVAFLINQVIYIFYTY